MSDSEEKTEDRAAAPGGATTRGGKLSLAVAVLNRIGWAVVRFIAIVWLLLGVLVFGQLGAVCTNLLTHILLGVELPIEGYYILLPTAMLSLLAQIVLYKPWPGRVDWIRSLLRGLTAIPFALVVLAIAGGILTCVLLQFAG